ncbi:hypothetical protein DdX_12093 [Ditylenchus destructor]|uniref:Uncharacterized protein n=1 Tax=Ditylenchus destructor TaxID=166010 RepID=A0AAD4R0R9_9BILA|nr:hypothetical protein DdX_12093 [Ditylenchus destructor]
MVIIKKFGEESASYTVNAKSDWWNKKAEIASVVLAVLSMLYGLPNLLSGDWHLRVLTLLDWISFVGLITAIFTRNSMLNLPFLVINAIYIGIYSVLAISFAPVILLLGQQTLRSYSDSLGRFTGIKLAYMFEEGNYGHAAPGLVLFLWFIAFLVSVLYFAAFEIIVYTTYKHMKNAQRESILPTTIADPHYSALIVQAPSARSDEEKMIIIASHSPM